MLSNILVVGYPKSGSTWVARLTGELLGCPVSGFWQSLHKEMAEEGEDRVSEFRVFKSHHQLHELKKLPQFEKNKIIYIIRDPRDVVISGAYYFEFKRKAIASKLANKLPKGRGFMLKMLLPLINSEQYRINIMMDAIFNGRPDVDNWLGVSWKEHYVPYYNEGFLFIRYEDLLLSPGTECMRILRHLGVDRNSSYIDKAVENQSFKKKKEFFHKQGELSKYSFMRTGKSRQWEGKLNEAQRSKFLTELFDDLVKLRYED